MPTPSCWGIEYPLLADLLPERFGSRERNVGEALEKDLTRILYPPGYGQLECPRSRPDAAAIPDKHGIVPKQPHTPYGVTDSRLRQQELGTAVAEIGHGAKAIRGDISVASDLDRVFSTIAAQSGRLDILFANAGGGEFAALGSITEAQFDKYFGINVKGTLFTVQKALPLMPAGSAIVINGSITSIKGTPAFGVYAATKAALRSFARTWASDLKGRDIRVNVVAPGVFVTPAYKTELGMSDAQIDQYIAHVKEITPLGRAGSPDEIAKSVSFLASDDASYITGIELFVDGGQAQV